MRLLALAATVTALVAVPATASARTSLVSVPISGPGDVQMLQSAGLDVTEAVRRDASAQVLLHGPADAARLARLSPPPRVRAPPRARRRRRRRGRPLRSAFGARRLGSAERPQLVPRLLRLLERARR